MQNEENKTGKRENGRKESRREEWAIKRRKCKKLMRRRKTGNKGRKISGIKYEQEVWNISIKRDKGDKRDVEK